MYFKLILFFILLLNTSLHSAELWVSSSQSIANIDNSDIRDLYLGKERYISDSDTPIILALFISKNSTEIFFSKVLGINERKYNSIWRKKLFSGTAIPPIKLKSDHDVNLFLDNNRNGLVISDQKITSKIKSIVINDEQ